jgi:uncharacterized OsmC-like protein
MSYTVHKLINKSTAYKKISCSIQSEDGMRKEAVVEDITGEKWKMTCDEGPYLNGADSAPPPLAYFSAGMAFGFISQLYLLAEESDILIEDYHMIQDSFYTIDGSAIRGTMVSGALPVDVKIEISTNSSDKRIEKLVASAKAQNPIYAYLETILDNDFQLFHNGQNLLDQVGSEEMATKEMKELKSFSSGEDYNLLEQIVSKQKQVETLFDVEGGKGTALKETQKRTLHLRAVTTPFKDGLSRTQVQVIKPLGSTFQFLCDMPKRIGGSLRTPSSLAYASAGIGFCFMTQIGRYAKIKKYELEAYRIEQATYFTVEQGGAKVHPIKTATHIDSKLSNETAKEILRMSEQTCFLHGAMKEEHPINLELKLNTKEYVINK